MIAIKNHSSTLFLKTSLLSCLLAFVPITKAAASDLQPGDPVAIKQDMYIPAISIIIDDLGYRLHAGKKAINLPGALTYAFLPHTPHAKFLSEKAHSLNKEIMLHLPMEADGGKLLGPGGLTQCMTHDKFKATLYQSLDSIPYAKGFNNHMGSYLTRSPLWMKQLMKEVVGRQIYFVDSKTTSESVASRIAAEQGVRHIDRDIFLDNDESPESIKRQLNKLVRKSRNRGYALAIAHPKPGTIKVLQQWLPGVEAMGIKLVPVSELISIKQQRRLAAWKPR